MNVTAPNGCEWGATSNASWIILTTPSTSSGNGIVACELRENFAASPRTGTISVAGQTFTIIQAGINYCTFTLSSGSQSFPNAGGTGTVNVTASSGCSWTAISNAGWIRVTKGASATGNGMVSFSVSLNTSNAARMGTMVIAGKTFTVKQKPR